MTCTWLSTTPGSRTSSPAKLDGVPPLKPRLQRFDGHHHAVAHRDAARHLPCPGNDSRSADYQIVLGHDVTPRLNRCACGRPASCHAERCRGGPRPTRIPISAAGPARCRFLQLEHAELQLGRLGRDEPVADHCQLHLVQLALDAGAVLVDRPQRQELIANREEPAPRGGARLPEERVPLDAVVHLSSAHSFAVHE